MRISHWNGRTGITEEIFSSAVLWYFPRTYLFKSVTPETICKFDKQCGEEHSTPIYFWVIAYLHDHKKATLWTDSVAWVFWLNQSRWIESFKAFSATSDTRRMKKVPAASIAWHRIWRSLTILLENMVVNLVICPVCMMMQIN